MKILNFRYTEDIDVSVSHNYTSTYIYLKTKDKIIYKINYRPYFQEIVFNYGFFDNNFSLNINYVKSTSKDGSAFLARVYVGGVFYAIRKKKLKSQIVFMKSAKTGFKNYQLGKDVVDAVCFYNGVVSRNDELLNDFFQKRQPKVFDEEKYIKSLDPEDRKEYLDNRKIESVIALIARKNKLRSDDVEHLSFYIECLEDDDAIKKKVLTDNNIDEIAIAVLPLLENAKRYYEKADSVTCSSSIFENKEYTIDSKYIFSNNNFDLSALNLKEDEMFVYDLLYFFEDEYEQIKEYLNKGIERVKKTIDDVLPLFKKYIENNNSQ